MPHHRFSRIAPPVLLVAIATACVGFAPGTKARAAALNPTTDQTLLEPPGSPGAPVPVKVGLYITNLGDIDEVRERVELDGYLIVSWKDPRLAAAPAASNGTNYWQRYREGQIWMPSLELANAVTRRERLSFSILANAQGSVRYVEHFDAQVSSDFLLRQFPFDKQNLQVIVQPFLTDRTQLELSVDLGSSGVGGDTWVELPEWKILGLAATAETLKIRNVVGDIPQIRFDLKVRRRLAFYLWKVFLPILIMVLVSWCVFWIELSQFDWQAKIVVTTMLTLIAFSFAIERNLPRIGYLTFFDGVFLTSFVFIFLAMIEITLIHVLHLRKRESAAAAIHSASRWVFPLVYFATIALMVPIFLM